MKNRTAESRRKARAFLEGIAQLAEESQLPPGVILRMFGLFARQLIRLDVAQGEDEDEEIVGALHRFTRGMGIQVVTIKLSTEADPAGGETEASK